MTYLEFWLGLEALLKSPVELHRFAECRFDIETDVEGGFETEGGLVGEGEGDVGTGETLLELGESECKDPVD